MLLGSAPMSLLGVALATHLQRIYGDSAESVEAKILGGALVVGGLGFFAKAILKQRTDTRGMEKLARREKVIAFGIGFVGGFVVGLTSVGSGTFFGLVMLIVFPLSAARIVGTDIFHAAALLWVAGVRPPRRRQRRPARDGLAARRLDPGVLIGSQLTLKLDDRALRLGLAGTLMLSGIKLLDVPGSSWLIVGGLVAGGLGLAVWSLTALRGRTRRLAEATALRDVRPEAAE